jgi:hypothetical protein
MADDKDGKYCSVCGGIPPDEIKIRRLLVDGKETGLDRLDWIIDEVMKMGLQDEGAIMEELMKRVKIFNYVPTKKTEAYAEALMDEYRQQAARSTGDD